jgi:hypothetical protein
MCPSDKPTLGYTRNATFRRLESWMDELDVKHFSFINVFDKPHVPTLSKVKGKPLITASQGYTNVLALGTFVSLALNRLMIEHFQLPHPSPLNRMLNDKQYEKQILEQCKDYLL